MSLKLTPESLRASYAYLRTTPPFNRWRMPQPDEVVFKVGRDRHTRGWIVCEPGKATITISENCIGQTASLMAVMAHEMLHLYQRETNMETGAEHNAAFWQLANRVCKHHGFDRKLF